MSKPIIKSHEIIAGKLKSIANVPVERVLIRFFFVIPIFSAADEERENGKNESFCTNCLTVAFVFVANIK